MKKMAICVPTIDHPAVVEEVLSYSVAFLKRYDTDIYYYDSSENNETRLTIESFRKKGFDNIFHIPVERDYLFGDKIDLIFSGYGLEKTYDYVWPIKDRKICNEEMLRLVLDRCQSDADVIVCLMLGNVFDNGYGEIDSPTELYKIFAKQTTSLETVVYNRNTILNDYTFGTARKAERYLSDFWHYYHLYDLLAKMDKTLISLISQDGAAIAEASIAPDSLWRDRIFEVWIDQWVRVNYELPDLYSPYKMQVIKNTASIDELLGKKETFERLHEQGILTKTSYEKYADMWEFITTVPVQEIKRIAES